MRIKMCVLLVFIVLLNIRILAQGGRMVVQLDFCVRGTQIDSTFRDALLHFWNAWNRIVCF